MIKPTDPYRQLVERLLRDVFTNEVIRAIAALRQEQTVCRERGGKVVFVSGMEAAREYAVETSADALARLLNAGDQDICDACAGTGTPTSGIPCMCGGSGRMSMAAVYLRETLIAARAQVQELEAERDELKAAFESKYEITKVVDLVKQIETERTAHAETKRKLDNLDARVSQLERWHGYSGEREEPS